MRNSFSFFLLVLCLSGSKEKRGTTILTCEKEATFSASQKDEKVNNERIVSPGCFFEVHFFPTDSYATVSLAPH
jgi:hypothetical protein